MAKSKNDIVKELFLEYQKTNDPAIRDKIIEENLYLAEILSRRYLGRGMEYEDIYQVACIGLILAVDRYDISKGFEFSSYATPTIVGEIKRFFRDKGWTIKVPRRIQELNKKINNAKISLSQKLERPPTPKEIAKNLDITEEEVIEVMEASKVYQPGSLDLSIDDAQDGELFLSDVIGDVDHTYERVENLDFLLKAMKNLNEMEKTIIIDRYIHKKTQIEIAKELDCSQMTVSRIEKKVLKMLRKELEKTMA